MLDHDTAEQIREVLASIQMIIYLATDVPGDAKDRIVNEISQNGFRVIDELEGVVR